MYYRSVVILVLINFYCYASPIPSVNQQTALVNQESDMMKPIIPETNNELSPKEKLHEFNYLKMLCELYGNCYNDQQMIDDDETKHKRLSSSLFHGIPKFGKRAFSSAFAGIPKFG